MRFGGLLKSSSKKMEKLHTLSAHVNGAAKENITTKKMNKLEPTLHKPVSMETRVRVNLFDNKSKDYTGIVVGIASLHILFTYIVLLDEQLNINEDVCRAVTVPGPLLRSEDVLSDWRL